MYLTRFQLNPLRRGAAKLLTSPHAMHAAVLGSFPDAAPTESGRVLWRLDTSPHQAFLYVVSPEKPDLTHLVEQAGWPTRQDHWDTREYAALLSRLGNGQRWAFRLRANPVRSTRPEGAERSKPFGHVTAAQQERWLLDRAAPLGFSLTNDSGEQTMRVTKRETVTFRRQSSQVTLRVAQYDGTLTITDHDVFAHVLTHGIGRAKGYGCGLLTIAPAS